MAYEAMIIAAHPDDAEVQSEVYAIKQEALDQYQSVFKVEGDGLLHMLHRGLEVIEFFVDDAQVEMVGGVFFFEFHRIALPGRGFAINTQRGVVDVVEHDVSQ